VVRFVNITACTAAAQAAAAVVAAVRVRAWVTNNMKHLGKHRFAATSTDLPEPFTH
jgi:hypothetical protein